MRSALRRSPHVPGELPRTRSLLSCPSLQGAEPHVLGTSPARHVAVLGCALTPPNRRHTQHGCREEEVAVVRGLPLLPHTLVRQVLALVIGLTWAAASAMAGSTASRVAATSTARPPFPGA